MSQDLVKEQRLKVLSEIKLTVALAVESGPSAAMSVRHTWVSLMRAGWGRHHCSWRWAPQSTSPMPYSSGDG